MAVEPVLRITVDLLSKLGQITPIAMKTMKEIRDRSKSLLRGFAVDWKNNCFDLNTTFKVDLVEGSEKEVQTALNYLIWSKCIVISDTANSEREFPIRFTEKGQTIAISLLDAMDREAAELAETNNEEGSERSLI